MAACGEVPWIVKNDNHVGEVVDRRVTVISDSFSLFTRGNVSLVVVLLVVGLSVVGLAPSPVPLTRFGCEIGNSGAMHAELILVVLQRQKKFGGGRGAAAAILQAREAEPTDQRLSVSTIRLYLPIDQ